MLWLQLLGELLLDRHNFTTMTRYISNPDNLKLMMNMLREKSRNIQFEAFHVFKVRLYSLSFLFEKKRITLFLLIFINCAFMPVNEIEVGKKHLNKIQHIKKSKPD